MYCVYLGILLNSVFAKITSQFSVRNSLKRLYNLFLSCRAQFVFVSLAFIFKKFLFLVYNYMPVTSYRHIFNF